MRVILADDHTMLRDGLRAILETAGIAVIGEAATGHEAIALAIRLAPDVVVMDIGMPGLNGIDATRRLRRDAPNIKVVALSMHADRQYVLAMLGAGAAGYLLKNAAAKQLITALEVVMRGETYVCPGVAPVGLNRVEQLALRSPSAPPSSAQAASPLTPREREVLRLLAEGKSSKEIAGALDIAVPTVETHRRQIMQKLDLRTVAELTKYAIRAGLTSAD